MDYEVFRNQGLISFEEVSPKGLKGKWEVKDINEKSSSKLKKKKEPTSPGWIKFSKILSPQIITSLTSCGFSNPTEIQSSVLAQEKYFNSINFILSPTGSGKTLAFLIPLINSTLSKSEIDGDHIKFLIVTPTKDLAFQIKDVCQRLIDSLRIKFKIAALTGGIFSEKQKRLLRNGIDLLIATPGRLKELLDLNTDFSKLQAVVFDEADRCLDPSQTSSRDLNYVMKKVVTSIKGKADFSVTCVSASLDPKTIANNSFIGMKQLKVKNQNLISSNIQANHSVSDYILHVLEEDKSALLFTLFNLSNHAKILVFVKAIFELSRLKDIATKLNVKVIKIDSTSRMGKRGKNIEKAFKSDKCICISTDLLARGIDFKGFDCVIQYSQPNDLAQFIHRRGRTGRDCSGSNYLISTPKDSQSTERLICRNFPHNEQNINFDQLEKMKIRIQKSEKSLKSKDSFVGSKDLIELAEELGQHI